MNYYVIAYRWGYIQESVCLFSSNDLKECIAVADHYPDYRGGKYGCAVYESPTLVQYMTDDYDWKIVHYSPSLYGESAPNYNHRCDVFNSVVTRITAHEEYENTAWVKAIIEDAEAFADKMNKALEERRLKS
jgi:hypothetical protein